VLDLALWTSFLETHRPHFRVSVLPGEAHSRVRELIEERGCELRYLPPYSPDLNPIEEAFSKIKGLLRKAEARTRDALIEAMSEALSAVSSRDARGFFAHRGYNLLVQSL